MSTAGTQPILDYYQLYGLDRAMKAKEIVKAIRLHQAKARDHMQTVKENSPELFKKVKQMCDMASEAAKCFKTEKAKKEYDKELDLAYQEGRIDVERQKVAESLIGEIENLFASGNYQGVVRRCNEALERKLYDEKLYSYLAQSYDFLGDLSKALNTIDSGLEIYPESIEILSVGARLYNVEQKDYDKAQSMINRMFEVEEDNKWANLEQIYLYLMFEKEELGYQSIDEYLGRHPQDQEFRSACAHDLISYSYGFYTKDTQNGIYVITSEEAYKKCVEITDKAVGICRDEITLEAQETVRRFGEKEFNKDNVENIFWSGLAAGIYLLMGVMMWATVPNSFVIAIIPIAFGLLLSYCTYQLVCVSNRPYWQLMKYYLTGQREKKEKKYIFIGKLLSFYMKWSVKAAIWIVRFCFRLGAR